MSLSLPLTTNANMIAQKKKKKKTGMNNGWIYIDKLIEYIYCSGKNKIVVHKLIGNKIK